jgi:hypothetical protein
MPAVAGAMMCAMPGPVPAPPGQRRRRNLAPAWRTLPAEGDIPLRVPPMPSPSRRSSVEPLGLRGMARVVVEPDGERVDCPWRSVGRSSSLTTSPWAAPATTARSRRLRIGLASRRSRAGGCNGRSPTLRRRWWRCPCATTTRAAAESGGVSLLSRFANRPPEPACSLRAIRRTYPRLRRGPPRL